MKDLEARKALCEKLTDKSFAFVWATLTVGPFPSLSASSCISILSAFLLHFPTVVFQFPLLSYSAPITATSDSSPVTKVDFYTWPSLMASRKYILDRKRQLEI